MELKYNTFILDRFEKEGWNNFFRENQIPLLVVKEVGKGAYKVIRTKEVEIPVSTSPKD